MKNQFRTNEKYCQTPNHCPVSDCQSEEIEGGSVSIEGQIAVQEVSCSACHCVWEDIYNLSSYRVLENPESH